VLCVLVGSCAPEGARRPTAHREEEDSTQQHTQHTAHSNPAAHTAARSEIDTGPFLLCIAAPLTNNTDHRCCTVQWTAAAAAAVQAARMEQQAQQEQQEQQEHHSQHLYNLRPLRL
jgi:hypothetical protein